MPIISKETWDKFDPTEQNKIRESYSNLLNALKREQTGFDEHLRLSSIQDRYISLFGKEALQPQLTYEDVARELFNDKMTIWFSSRGTILKNLGNKINCTDATNVTSEKQAEKLMALNKLMNVAVYLNQNWKPNWEDREEKKFMFFIEDDELKIGWEQPLNSSPVYFRTEGLANQAIGILGEEAIRTALSSDF